jgi:hypothetical protein
MCIRGMATLIRRPQQLDFRLGGQDRGDSISKEPATLDRCLSDNQRAESRSSLARPVI